MAIIPFIGQHYQDRSPDFSQEKLVNLYLELSQNQMSKGMAKLIGTPGKSLYSTVTPTTSGGNRACYTTSNGRFFTVVGDTLSEIDINGTATNRGTINTDSGTVKMVDNGLQLMIVDGDAGYIFTLATNVLATISDADFPNGATHVVFMDQYFIVNKPNTREFYISALLDGTSWVATEFGTAEYGPDSILSLATLKSNLWVFCENTIEVFYNSGNSDFPFTRIQGAVQEFGVYARYSVAKNNNSIFWLGSNEEGNNVVFKSSGYNAVRISDHSIEYTIGQFANGTDDAIGYTYQEEGHYFYVLTFLKGNKTLVYDDSNGLWHERNYRNPTTGDFNKERAVYQALFNGKNYVGDFNNGNIYELDLDTYTDNGDTIVRDRIGPIQSVEDKRLYYKSVQIEMEEGVGLTSGQGSDPLIMLRWTTDSSRDFGNEHFIKFGAIGEYGKRAIIRRLGAARNRLFWLRISDPVKVSLVNMIADVEVE